jgi:hypothetical protein
LSYFPITGKSGPEFASADETFSGERLKAEDCQKLKQALRDSKKRDVAVFPFSLKLC